MWFYWICIYNASECGRNDCDTTDDAVYYDDDDDDDIEQAWALGSSNRCDAQT